MDDALRWAIETLEAGLGDRRRGLPAKVQWRWHDRCPPDLLEAQRPYARFF